MKYHKPKRYSHCCCFSQRLLKHVCCITDRQHTSTCFNMNSFLSAIFCLCDTKWNRNTNLSSLTSVLRIILFLRSDKWEQKAKQNKTMSWWWNAMNSWRCKFKNKNKSGTMWRVTTSIIICITELIYLAVQE